MRGLAAISVLFFHVFNNALEAVPASAITPAWRQVGSLAGLGTLGVDVFFVLSGFLITSLLLSDRCKQFYFSNFYWKRVLRIQPVYLIHLAFAWWINPYGHGYVLLGLVFLVNFHTFFKAQDGPAWTLSIEEQFYLIWPQVVRRVSLARLYAISIVVMMGSCALRTGSILIAHHAAVRATWYRFDGLAMGALLACQWMGEGEEQTPAVRRFLSAFNSRTALAGACLWELLLLAGATTSLGLAVFPTSYLSYRLIRFVMAKPGSAWFGWLGARPLRFLGDISYSLYMLHTLIIFVYDTRVARPSLEPAPFAVRAVVVTISTGLVCVLIRHAVELPVQKLRRFVVRPGTPTLDVPEAAGAVGESV